MKKINITSAITIFETIEKYKLKGSNHYNGSESDLLKLISNYDKLIDPIKEELTIIQKNSRTRIISVDDIIKNVIKIIKRLPDHHKKDMEGFIGSINLYGGKFPKAYKYIPYGTIFTITFQNNKWYLLDIKRSNCNRKKYNFTIPEALKEKIIDYYTIGGFME